MLGEEVVALMRDLREREELLELLERIGYSREATPIEPVEGEVKARLLDDRSYVFHFHAHPTA